MKIYRAVKSAFYWAFAMQKYDKYDYDSAYSKLMVVEKYLKTNVEYLAMVGLVEHFRKNYQNGNRYLDKAVEILDSLGPDSKLSKMDQLYMRAYVQRLNLMMSVVLPGKPLSEKNLHLVDLADIQLSEVKNKYKKNFPLRDHPSWGEPEREGSVNSSSKRTTKDFR